MQMAPAETEPQHDQKNEAGQSNIARALKTEVSLELQPTKVEQSYTKHGDHVK